MIRTIILDWSGTIADDLETTQTAANLAAAELGGEPIDLAVIAGAVCTESWESRVTKDRSEQWQMLFEAHYLRAARGAALRPDVEFLLRLAGHHSIELHILTAWPQSTVKAWLERVDLAKFVGEVHGQVIDKRESLRSLTTRLAMPRDAILYVGDTVEDIQAARDVGLRSGAALYGYTPSDQLTALKPDYCFAGVREICSLIERESSADASRGVLATVGGLVSDAKGRVLLVRTTKWRNHFGVPGGKIEYGETMVDAYRREIAEECNLQLENIEFLLIQDCIEAHEFYRPRHFLLINFHSRALNPEELRVNYEISEARWVAPSQALTLDLNRPTRVLLEEAGRRGLIDLGMKP